MNARAWATDTDAERGRSPACRHLFSTAFEKAVRSRALTNAASPKHSPPSKALARTDSYRSARRFPLEASRVQLDCYSSRPRDGLPVSSNRAPLGRHNRRALRRMETRSHMQRCITPAAMRPATGERPGRCKIRDADRIRLRCRSFIPDRCADPHPPFGHLLPRGRSSRRSKVGGDQEGRLRPRSRPHPPLRLNCRAPRPTAHA